MKTLKTAFTLVSLLAIAIQGVPTRAATLQADPAQAGAFHDTAVLTAWPATPTAAPTAAVQTPKLQLSSSAEGQLLARLNQIRVAGVNCPGSGPRPATAALKSAAPHAAAALRQASYMAQSGEVSHIGPGGTTPRVRAASSGIRTVSVTEIIYLGSRLDPEAAVNWWLHSPVHCSVMTDGRYTTAGASVVRGNRGTAYVMVLTSTPN